jgi:hypothetical protein
VSAPRCQGDVLDLARHAGPLGGGAPVAELQGDDPVSVDVEDPPVADLPASSTLRMFGLDWRYRPSLLEVVPWGRSTSKETVWFSGTR